MPDQPPPNQPEPQPTIAPQAPQPSSAETYLKIAGVVVGILGGIAGLFKVCQFGLAQLFFM